MPICAGRRCSTIAMASARPTLLLTELQERDRKRLPNYPVPAIRMGRLAWPSDCRECADAVSVAGNFAMRPKAGVHKLNSAAPSCRVEPGASIVVTQRSPWSFLPSYRPR